MPKIILYLLDQENREKLIAKMTADYLRNRELGNGTMARNLQRKVLRAMEIDSARKVSDESVREYDQLVSIRGIKKSY